MKIRLRFLTLVVECAAYPFGTERTLTAFSVLLVAIAAVFSTARAEVLTQSIDFSIPDASSQWKMGNTTVAQPTDLSFPQFDVAQGNLTSVSWSLQVGLDTPATLIWQNTTGGWLGGVGQTFRLRTGYKLDAPDWHPNSHTNFNWNWRNFGIAPGDSMTCTGTGGNLDLGPFVPSAFTAYQGTGSVTVRVSKYAYSSYSGALDGLATWFDHTGTSVGNVTVTYEYTPPYDRKLTNVHHAQKRYYYCGPATAQMILDSEGAHVTPLPSQDTLYAQIQQHNNSPEPQRWYTDAVGLRDTLTFYDPAHTYVAHSMANFDAANRTLAYNIDHYSIPAGALIYGGDHWINVRGINTSVEPALTGADTDFTVNGFYVRDPWSGFAPGQGLGKDAYIPNNAIGWQRIFTPVGYAGTWKGNYVFVTDPDVTTDTSDSAPAPGSLSVDDPATALAQAAYHVSLIAGLWGDLSFQNGSFSSAGELEMTLSDGTHEWLVPYYQDGANEPSGVVLINAATSDLDGAFWNEGVLTGDSLASFVDYLEGVYFEGFISDNIAVPEPSTIVLLIVGAISVLAYACSKRRAASPKRSHCFRSTDALSCPA